MRNYVVVPVTIVALAGLMLVSGCVSKAEYDKVLAHNRRAQAELDKSLKALQELRSQQDAMLAQLAERDATIAARQEEITLLDAKNKALQEKFDELQAHYQKAVKGGEIPPPVGPILPGPVDEALRRFAKDNPDLVEYLPELGMVKFKSDFTFAKGSDDLSADAVGALGKLVQILNSPAAAKFNVYIAGHTDDIPIKKAETLRRHPTNWYLSAHRAVEVQKQVVKDGLTASRIAVMGFGEYHPIAPNAPGNKGNAKNRRVEIWIVPSDRFLTQPMEVEPAK